MYIQQRALTTQLLTPLTGLAVRHDASTGGVDIAVTNRVGTKRYMAPEVLDETIITSLIHSYKMADIYALALVFWELFMRCEVNGMRKF